MPTEHIRWRDGTLGRLDSRAIRALFNIPIPSESSSSRMGAPSAEPAGAPENHQQAAALPNADKLQIPPQSWRPVGWPNRRPRQTVRRVGRPLPGAEAGKSCQEGQCLAAGRPTNDRQPRPCQSCLPLRPFRCILRSRQHMPLGRRKRHCDAHLAAAQGLSPTWPAPLTSSKYVAPPTSNAVGINPRNLEPRLGPHSRFPDARRRLAVSLTDSAGNIKIVALRHCHSGGCAPLAACMLGQRSSIGGAVAQSPAKPASQWPIAGDRSVALLGSSSQLPLAC